MPALQHRHHRHHRAAAVVAAAALGVGCLVAVSAGADAAGTDLAVNGGFETGSLTGWTCDAGTGSVVGAPVHSGAHSLAGAATASDNAQCSQTVSVQPNSAYTLSAYVEGAYVYLGADGYSSTWT